MKKTGLFLTIFVFVFTGCSTAGKKTYYSPRQTQVIEFEDEVMLTEEINEIYSDTEEQPQGDAVEDNFDIEMPDETQAEVVERKLFNLGKSPSQAAVTDFRRNLDNCFMSAIHRLDEEDYYDKGLSYIIVPSAVVYPFSRTEVQCIAGSPYAEELGKQFCEIFFACVKQRYNN